MEDKILEAKYCKFCDYWGKVFRAPEGLPPEAYEDLKDTHRECEHPESPVMLAPENFGCILSLK